MLALTRRIGEEIIIDRGVRVVVLAVHGRRVRLGVQAPPNVRVDRKEVHQARSRRSHVLAGVNGSDESRP
jgi:carbon storage regulator